MVKIRKEEIIEANKILCAEFGQQGTVLNDANLDFAVDQYNQRDATHVELARKIIRNHPFVDGNKRTAFVVYFYLSKVEGSSNPLITMPVVGLGLVSYTRRMLQQEPWHNWLRLLSEV